MIDPDKMTTLVVFIPAYNEAETITDVIESVPSSIPSIDHVEIVVIDDGSKDETAELAERAGALVVRHPRNLGLAEAFRTGIRTCLEQEATIAASIDADMQFSPLEIPSLIQPILEGSADFVAADRFSGRTRPQNMPLVKYHGNRIMTWVVNMLTRQAFTDVSSGYRAYSREALLNLNVQSSYTYTQETFIELAAKGLPIVQVPVEVRYDSQRESRLVRNVLQYAFRTFLTIIRATRDYAPMTIFGIGAAIFIVPGSLLGIAILIRYILTGSFTPYIFLALTAVYLFTLGIALIALSLVADMLRGIRNNQERLLYFSKRSIYDFVPGKPPDRNT